MVKTLAFVPSTSLTIYLKGKVEFKHLGIIRKRCRVFSRVVTPPPTGKNFLMVLYSCLGLEVCDKINTLILLDISISVTDVLPLI